MANTYVDYTAVASQTDYNFSFEYLRDEHVKVKVNDVIVTNYTIVTSPTPTKIRFNTAPTAGADIKIYRDSRGDFSPLVDFVNGSVLTESELDEAYKHNLFVSQEASEGTGNELLNKKGGANYDAEGNKIINLGTPTASTDAANKGYTDQTIDNAIALGGSPAIVSLGGYDVTALSSLTPRSLANRFADVVNVLDYGATGDGVTDDTSAIQAALNSGAKTIKIPQGTYLVSSSFDINDQNISGYSRNETTIKSTGNIQQVFRLGGDGSITNLTIDLNSQPTVGIVLTSFTGSGSDYRSGVVDSVVLKNAGYTSPTSITNIVAGSGITTVTASGHGLSNNDLVRIENVNGLVSQADPSRSVVDAYFHVYDVTSTTFKLAWDCEDYLTVDSTGYTAYSSGGTVTRVGAGIVQRKVNEYPGGQEAPHSVNNVIFNNNYSHIITFFSLYTSFNELLLKSTTGGHSIAQVFGTYHARFKNCFINTGVWINTGCRDGVFDSCRFQTEDNWLDPVIDAEGHNTGDGSEGGELANYTFTACTFEHNNSSFVGPYILTNGYGWSFKNCVTRIKSSVTWTWANFYSTLYLELTQLTFESRNASVWYLTDATNGTGVHTRANGLWSTQSAGPGTCYWGRQRYGSLLSNNSFVEVKNSNMNHAIASTGNGGERYNFEHIEGNLDLTNAVDGRVRIYAVSGTITAPEKLFEFSPEDYVTQTTTPYLVFGTGITYNSQVGKSIQIKDIVLISFSIDIATSDNTDTSQIALGGIDPNISSTYQPVSCNVDVGASTFFNIATHGVPHGEYSGSFELKFYKSNGTALRFNDCATSGVIKGVMIFVTD